MHRRSVLLVAKVRAGGERYYLEATPGPGRRGIETPGRWAGSAAPPLGLFGVVGDGDLAAVMAGRDPAGGHVLGGARARVEVCGLDLTFAAPKSVSILFALADPEVGEAVRSAHDRAVVAAMGYVERHAAAVRRPVDGAKRVPVHSQTVAATFVHRTSRALDPHLHSHVVLANLGQAPDGSWSALDGRGIYAHRAATDSLYHCQLRYELTTALGVQWGRLDRGRADIVGIGPEARRAFSSRAAQIALDLEAHGFPTDGRSPRSASLVAAVATRADRRLDVGVEELVPAWRRRAIEVGLGPRQIEHVVDRGQRYEQASPAPDVESLAATVAGSPVTEGPFARRQVVVAMAGRHRAGTPSPVVERDVDLFMALTEPAPGASDYGRLDRPGVAEPRRVARQLLRRRDLEALLARRGMTLARSIEQDHSIDFGLG
jgi:conjugative relaxase-like TrwC/TraI family protein